MDAGRFQRLRTLYERAAELPRGERTPFLDDACDGDAALRAEALRMLAAGAAPDFLARPDEEGASPLPLPENVGSYRVLSLLGEGGFGVVYRAEQREPVQRVVALKVLHRHRTDERSILRFEAESQTLARLQHAGIAQLYDAGRSADGLQYLAMEYVDGRPLTVDCDRRGLSVAARLELFLRVGGAVQHAHQRGVVHRDLKPSNVLVKEEDGHATPKVIDFGIAKLLDETRASGFATREGAPLGTPGYMSPEQAAGEPVDTRTDVYALGVLLFELLAGDLPFPRERLASGNAAEVLRIVREEEPRRMSTALREASAGGDLVAAQRATEPGALGRALRGDLEWIVRRALAKDPDARYPSVSALLEDVERYRRSEPVVAREPAALYVLRRFVARHRLGVGLSLASAVLLAVGVVMLLWALRAVSGARDRAVLNEYAAQLTAARAALAIGNADGARRHLLAAAPEHRGWEWRHLAELCESSAARHAVGPVYDLAWFDGERLLCRAPGTALELRSAATGALERTFATGGSELDDFVLDRARGRLVVDGRTRLELWGVASGTGPEVLFVPEDLPPPYVWPDNAGDVRALALSPDGEVLYFSDNTGAVRALELEGDGEARVLCALDAFCWAIEVLGEGDGLALATVAGRVELRDARSGAPLRAPLELHSEDVKALASSADGRTLYAAAGDTLQAWDVAEGRLLARCAVAVPLLRLELARDGELLYGSGEGARGGLTAWDARTLEVRARFHGHRGGVGGLALHPDGARIASGSLDGTIRLWDLPPPAGVRRLEAGFGAGDLAVAADGSAFATVDARGGVRVWDARSCELELLVELGVLLRGCALGATEVFVADDGVRAVDRATGAVRDGDPPPSPPAALVLDPGERWLFAALRGGERAALWSLPDLRLERVFELPHDGRAAFDAATGRFELVHPGGGGHRVEPGTGRVESRDALPASLDLRTTVPTALAPVGGAPGALGAGRRVAVGGDDGLVRIHDLVGTELLVLDEALKPVPEVRFALGGTRLLARSYLPGSPTYVLVWSAPASVTLAR